MIELDRLRWRALLGRLGGTDPGEQCLQQLQQAWNESHRYYHNVTHLRGCLKLIDALRPHLQRPDEAELALWFHRAVLRHRSEHNEADSAAWARRFIDQAGIDPAAGPRTAELILATRPRDHGQRGDAALVSDIALAVLGTPAPVHDDYEQRLRRESGWQDDVSYARQRGDCLQQWLQRPAIYHSALMEGLLGSQARQNLQRWQEKWARLG